MSSRRRSQEKPIDLLESGASAVLRHGWSSRQAPRDKPTPETRQIEMNILKAHGVASLLGIPALCTGFAIASTPSIDGAVRTNEAATFTASSSISSANQAASSTPVPTVIRSTGAIEGDVDLFRALLGGANNGATPGQQLTGRREINWDGVPAAVTNVPTFPVDFFNVNSPRGLIYDLQSPGLEVSDQSFLDVNPDYTGEFTPFSGHKLFSPVGNNETSLHFAVAGSSTKAATRGIGIVFADVDTIGATAIELLGANGSKLGRFTVPIRSDRRGVSFLGIVFRDPVIHQVHIITGDGALEAGSLDLKHGGQHDLVVMDDFLYGEPNAVRD
jgi:hypothetical protein